MDATDETTSATPVGIRPAPLPASVRDRFVFIPEHYRKPDGSIPDDACVYLLAMPTEQGLNEWRRLWRREGAAPVDEAKLLAERLAAVDLCCVEMERGGLRDAIERQAELEREFAMGGLSTERFQERLQLILKVADFDQIARRVHPPLAGLLADSDFFEETSRTIAVRLWCRGITTASDIEYAQVRDFKRDGMNRVTDEEMAGIPYRDKLEIGRQAIVLRALTAAQKKNLRLAVYVAMFPQEFTDIELNATRRRARVWDVLGETHTTNPAHAIGLDEQAMLRLWGLYEQGHLPDAVRDDGLAAGALDQVSVMVAAFGVMSNARADAMEERRRLQGARGRGH